MSDFTSPFWDYAIAIITVVSILACGVFLWVHSKHKVALDERTGEPQTTGHVWDGDLQEFHNPLPRWWMWLFYITIVFSIVYLILYPGLGTQFRGVLGWTSSGQHAAEVKAAEARFGPIFAGFLAQPVEKVAQDARGRQMGERIFLNNCAQCHGSDARGSRGFPSLANGDWQWGRTPEAIRTSIAEGRLAAMPPMAAAVGGTEDVIDVAHYVLSLSGSANDSVRAARGQARFAACAACHGADGKGNTALGAPNLTNKIWLYGGTVSAIAESIAEGRQGVMPPWKGILTEAEIHLVTAYLYGLDQPATAAAPARP